MQSDNLYLVTGMIRLFKFYVIINMVGLPILGYLFCFFFPLFLPLLGNKEISEVIYV